jgi:tRNA-splicing ligase RtcB
VPEHLSPTLINWASILEDNTRHQAETTATMPFVYPHVALMPDAHLGKGATVGSVIPTDRAIIPAAVGVDIGCGMLAVRTQFSRDEVIAAGDLADLHESISRRIPLSAGRYNSKIQDTAVAKLGQLSGLAEVADFDPASYAGNWELQLGSLGSGNHFIEVTVDEQDRVWLFLHSGSRGVGNKIAVKHIKVAQQQMQKWWITLPDPDLAYLVEGTDEFWAYMKQMRWAQQFAWLNREEMMDRCVEALARHAGQDVERLETIGCHHNYTEREKHFGRHVWLSRKGAIDASEGVRGLIPGSMGAASYVVTGKGNPLSLNSSPHGAGRNFSRNVARKKFTRESLDAAMEGVAWGNSNAFLDEHPEAYKPIDQIMKDADDLVTIDHTLRQIVNVKGD